MTVTCRLETPEDEAFLRRLIVEATMLKLGAQAWPQPMRDHLLGIQYTSRLGTIRGNYPDALSRIILLDGMPAGWVVTAELENRIHLVEIMVLAEHRGKGIGSSVMGEIIAAAGSARKPVRLHVDPLNSSAIQLYERLGFRRTGGDLVEHEMAWQSLDSASPPAS